ncbi:aldehyde dehydrogenase family protein [Actinacidiphila sp. bgisy160]|uniref:aldehyde dehydrogenase family protein n=1 Tax=Actinacidiphila sp. bgisy160 TaxID=3413796 RepID=UPI003D73BE86
MDVRALNAAALDRSIADLRRGAGSWAASPLADRIVMLERLLPRVLSRSDVMVTAAARAKGYGPSSAWAAEDWAGGPWALVQSATAYLHVLRRIANGQDPVKTQNIHVRGARVHVDVFPVTGWDRMLLNGFSARVWMRPGVTARQVRDRAASPHRSDGFRPGVSLVLGAGNVAAIVALDILHKLYVEGQAVIAKMNPVNSYLKPHFEYVFGEFIARDWVRFVDGGAREGEYLVRHEGVDTVHVTGSGRTRDAIVWGTGTDAMDRRRRGQRLMNKPLSSELGGVSPCLVAPGPWRAADFRFQAENIVTSKLNNSGHNCIASQILVVPRDWDGTERLLQEIRRLLRALPPRSNYYPGADDRLGKVATAHPEAEVYGDGSRLLVPDITDFDGPLIKSEVFGDALGVVRLPGGSTLDYLTKAAEFANDMLPGSLGATLIAHPKTLRTDREVLERIIDRLQFGTVGVNCWAGLGFLLGYAPWGAFPGNTQQDVGSGIGFVHNAFMLEDIEKSVLYAPFAPAPRGLFQGAPSMSPRPPFFVTNRSALTTMRLVTRFTAAPSLLALPAIFASAMRG